MPSVDSLRFYELRPDSTYGPDSTTRSWRIDAALYSDHISGVERLPNDNTLACVGPWGMLLEFTPDGRIVWEYINPVTAAGPQDQGDSIPYAMNEVFKVRRYAPDYPGFVGHRLNPIGPIEHYHQAVEQRASTGIDCRGLSANPAVTRASVTLSYALPVAGNAELAVFNSLGRRAATLVSGRLEAGTHRVTWNPAGLTAGTYFCILKQGPVTWQTSVTLLH